MKTVAKIYDQIDISYEKDYSGMSYAEGVRAALEWVLGDSDAPAPFEDED